MLRLVRSPEHHQQAATIRLRSKRKILSVQQISHIRVRLFSRLLPMWSSSLLVAVVGADLITIRTIGNGISRGVALLTKVRMVLVVEHMVAVAVTFRL